MPVSISGAGSISGLDQGFYVTTGKVGIGTNIITDNSVFVELVADSSQVPRLQFDNKPVVGTNNGEVGSILFRNNTDSVGYIICKRESAADDGYIQFGTQATGGGVTERLRIDSVGRLLLGTTTEGAVNADNFTVADSGNCGITIRSGTSNSGNLYFSDATSGTAEFDGAIAYDHPDQRMMLYTASTERLRITSDGQMGLGTNDPNSYGGSVKLAVANTSGTCGLSIVSATDGDGNLYYADGTSGDATYRGYIRYNHTLDQLRIGVAGAERLRITSAGKVLINSTDASNNATMVVKGLTDNNHPIIKVRGTNANGYTFLGDDYSGGDESQFTMGLAYSGASLVTGWGVRVSTSANDTYLSSQDTYSTKHSAIKHDGNGWRFLSNSTSQTVTTGSAVTLTERLRITPAGDVGIGENSPADRLVVQETNASGDVAVRIKNDTLTDGSASTPTTASLYLNTSTGDFNTFYIQARRYDNDTHFGYSNPRDGGHTPNMIITNEGQIKTPKQPSFFSRPPASYNLSSGENSPIGGTWQDVHDIGSHFSNGTFTAPVAGTYQFDWAVFVQNETTRLDAIILVNGTNVMREEINGYPNSASNKSASVHGCYYLSANDNVTFGVYTAAGTNIYVASAPWSYASGFLVG